MNLSALTKPLTICDIDFRVQSINKGGYATILAYKDARVDMMRLDEACGPLGWKREHSRDNHNCIVSIWSAEIGQWVSKEDTGTESNAEAQKGLASDSFKRACFNWGIGRELYDYPMISVKLNDNECDKSGNKVKATWNLKLRDWIWCSQFDEGGKVTYLAAKYNGQLRFAYGQFRKDVKVQGEVINEQSQEQHTEEQKKILDVLMQYDKPIEMYIFLEQLSEGVKLSLARSFPQGSKGENQKHMRNLTKKGRDIFDKYLADIAASVEGDDHEGAQELMSELEPLAQSLIYERINNDVSYALHQIMERAA